MLVEVRLKYDMTRTTKDDVSMTNMTSPAQPREVNGSSKAESCTGTLANTFQSFD